MVLLFLFFALLGIRSNRFTFDYVVLTAPFSVLEFFVFWPSIFINLTAGLSLTLIFLLIFIWSATASQKTRGMGFSNNDFPIAAANFILQNNIKGNMYNSFGMGSYLIWHLYPRYQVFIDSRAQNYIQGGQNSLLADYSRISEDISAWGKMDEKYNFDFAIVDWPSITDNKSYNITEQNFTADKWAVVFMDSRALVYLKRTEANKQLIDKYEYKYIKPQELDLSYFQEYLSDSPKWLYAQQEIRRLLDQRPDNYRAHFIYSAFLAQNPASNKEEIIAHLKKTIDLDPSFDQARKALKSLFGINY